MYRCIATDMQVHRHGLPCMPKPENRPLIGCIATTRLPAIGSFHDSSTEEELPRKGITKIRLGIRKPNTDI